MNIGQDSTIKCITYSTDPVGGARTIITIHGTEEGLLPLFQSCIAQGMTAHLRQINGPVFEIEVQTPTTEATTRYSFRKQFTELDLRGHPELIERAGSATQLAAVIKEIDRAVDAGENYDPTADGIGGIWDDLYRSWARGVRAYPEERLVLRRTRIADVSVEPPVVPQIFPSVYTTETLIETFGIPPTYANLLPDNPAFVPPGTAWGWLIQDESLDIVADTGRTEHTIEWVFAAWDEMLYEVI